MHSYWRTYPPELLSSTVVQWLGYMIPVAILSFIHIQTPRLLSFFMLTRCRGLPLASDACPGLYQAFFWYLPFFHTPTLIMAVEAAFWQQHSPSFGKWGCFQMSRTSCIKTPKHRRVHRSPWPLEWPHSWAASRLTRVTDLDAAQEVN